MINEEIEKAKDYLRKNKKVTPLQLGRFLGYYYYDASPKGRKILLLLCKKKFAKHELGKEYYLNN